mgnify:CR=1 FL=1
MKELRKMQDCVKEVRDLESSYEDINALIELTEEEEDREMIKEIQREIAKFEKNLKISGSGRFFRENMIPAMQL